MNCICIRCKTEFDNTDNNTCDMCIAYIGQTMVCTFCGDTFTRTNKSRHMRSFRCISRHGELCCS